ncbi:MAG: hypothetical protein WCR72_10905 [Bacteroidota bacterium]
MPKKNKHPSDSENVSCPSDSENSIENIKYIKKLELQHAVLSKLMESGNTRPLADTDFDPDFPETNNQ